MHLQVLLYVLNLSSHFKRHLHWDWRLKWEDKFKTWHSWCLSVGPASPTLSQHCDSDVSNPVLALSQHLYSSTIRDHRRSRTHCMGTRHVPSGSDSLIMLIMLMRMTYSTIFLSLLIKVILFQRVVWYIIRWRSPLHHVCPVYLRVQLAPVCGGHGTIDRGYRHTRMEENRERVGHPA